MYDTGKILTGLVIFVGLLGVPFWYGTAGAKEPPTLETPKGKACVEKTEYMKTNHMQLLYDWRESVVREGKRQHLCPDGTVRDKSLTETCLDCHSKVEFCTRCHDYAGVRQPYCWDCHTDPKEAK